MLITEALGKTEDEIIADTCEAMIEYGGIPYTCWGVVRVLTWLEWAYVRQLVGRAN